MTSFADVGEKYDIAILGSHLATGLLAAILAKNGVRVLMVDSEGTGELAGETTVPYTAEVFFTLARRFGIPEIAPLGITRDMPDAIRRASGVKRSLGFLYHVPGTEQDPRQCLQFNVPGEHSEWHPNRSDVDEYARGIAQAYGARLVRYRPGVADVLLGPGDPVILTGDGAAYRARYVVDAIGHESPVLRGLPLPDPPARLRHRPYVITTHMRGVRPYEAAIPDGVAGKASPWWLGTISHLFPGGWLEVAHFDNHEDSAGQRCSVTLSVDAGAFADLPKDPALAFRRVIECFPGIARCFAEAIPACSWVTHQDWQAVPATAADRAFLFERSAGRLDPFLSCDITVAAELVHAIAPVLIRAAAADDWSARRFALASGFQSALFDFHDRMLACARIATRDFQLWNAFSRVWLLWSMLAALSLKSARNQCLRTGDWAAVERLSDGPHWFALPNGLAELLCEVMALVEEVGQDAVLPRAAASQIFARLRAAPFVPPLYGFGDPDDRFYYFSTLKRLRMLAWVKTLAPPEFRTMLTRENLTNVPPPAVH